MNPDISIIVPIYKVEKFLDRCVESLKNQTLKNIEIILVDDGSPDKSGIMADEYALNDDRIRVIHQENKGLSGARNSGLRIASAKYVMFVDSDDYLEYDACEKLLECVKKVDCEVIFFDFNLLDKNNNVISKSNFELPPDQMIENQQVQEILYPIIISNHSLNTAWNRLYNKSFLLSNNLYFDEKVRYAEDYEYCLRLFPKIKTMFYFTCPLYNYVENSDSLTHASDSKIAEKLIELYRLREIFLKKHNLKTPENLRLSGELLIKMLISHLDRYLIAYNSFYDKLSAIKRMINDKYVRRALHYVDISKMSSGLYGKSICRFMKMKMSLAIMVLYNLEKKKLRNH